MPRTVLLLGFTSLFTDVSSEMVTAILPVYLVLQLGLSPAQFGLVDGLYRGVAGLSAMAAGLLSDWLGRPKLVAAIGYGLSAMTRPLLVMASAVATVAGLISLDRIGKGVRTAPRDAMIASASRPAELGHSFGVHRAMDTLGALLGPLVAFGILLVLPGRFDAVFVVSTAFAVVGLAVLVLLVPGRRSAAAPRSVPESDSEAVSSPRLTRTDLASLARSGSFLVNVGVAGALTVFTVSDAFIFLALLERDADLAKVFPLLAVGLAATYAVTAVPVGRLADRWGRMRVYLGGHVVLLAVYVVLGAAVGAAPATVIVVLLLLGVFYAATDGVLAAAVSAVLPEVSRASGLSFAQSVLAVSGLLSSLLFGLLLGRIGGAASYLLMAVGLTVAIAVAVWLLRRLPAGGVSA